MRRWNMEHLLESKKLTRPVALLLCLWHARNRINFGLDAELEQADAVSTPEIQPRRAYTALNSNRYLACKLEFHLTLPAPCISHDNIHNFPDSFPRSYSKWLSSRLFRSQLNHRPSTHLLVVDGISFHIQKNLNLPLLE